MTPGIFRSVIVANWLLIAAAVVVTFATEHRLPDPLRAYLEADAASPPDGRETNDLILLSLAVVFYLVVTAGLFCFKRWARTLLPFAFLASIAVTLFDGPVVSHGLVAAIEYAAGIIDGVTLMAAFLPPIDDRFRTR